MAPPLASGEGVAARGPSAHSLSASLQAELPLGGLAFQLWHLAVAAGGEISANLGQDRTAGEGVFASIHLLAEEVSEGPMPAAGDFGIGAGLIGAAGGPENVVGDSFFKQGMAQSARPFVFNLLERGQGWWWQIAGFAIQQ